MTTSLPAITVFESPSAVTPSTSVLRGVSRARGVRVGHDGSVLRASVRDDGRGGADVGRGTGLQGLERRIAAFDGRLEVDSPVGGPTTVSVVVPCRLVAAGDGAQDGLGAVGSREG